MDKNLRHRINAGRVAVNNQIDFFRKQFGRVPSEWKDDDSRVTFVDFAISEKTIAELQRVFPKDKFCSEESNPQDEVIDVSQGYSWIIDPVDGTNNYALGFPHCAISLALLKAGRPVYGFIYDMSRDKLIEGGPGLGLKDGTRRISINENPLTKQSLIGYSFPVAEQVVKRILPFLSRYKSRSIGSGSLMLTYTALGLLDGCLDYRVKVWDIAAGYALILASNRNIQFIDHEVFPMTTFHPQAPSTPYYCGSPEFCMAMKEAGF